MRRTIEQILSLYTHTIAEDWRQLESGAWAHKNAKIGAKVTSYEDAVFLGGEIWGGVIRGGVIRGGVIWGGEIWGGVIWGGVIRGGVIWGGEIWGGVIRGGVIRGGVIRGGVIRGGVIWGGEWTVTPLFIAGTSWPLTHTKPGHIAIGCQIHSIEVWRKRGEQIGRENGFDDAKIAEYALYIELIAARDLALFGVSVEAEAE
jgi:hypothetical protein